MADRGIKSNKFKPTPDEGVAINELHRVNGTETRRDIIVDTNQGGKRMGIDDFLEMFNYEIGSYKFYARQFPMNCAVPMLGGVLDPDDFEDGLKTLKERIPLTWIRKEDGKVELPIIHDYVLQMDVNLPFGFTQEDQMQDISNAFRLSSSRGNSTGSFYCVSHKYRENFVNDARGVFTAHNVGPAASRTPGDYTSYETEIRVDMNLNTSSSLNFSLGSLRLGDCTRERTLNGVLCLIVGRIKNQNTSTRETKKYILSGPGKNMLEFILGKNGDGIGVNRQYLMPID